jgi:NDP-sugar pyrophosphorylase family protein
VNREPALTGGIIAAGEGSRLRQAGWNVPKPLVPVAGVPLIGSVIANFHAAGISSLRVIVNEEARECVDWVRARFPGADVEFIVKTTASSLESFVEVTGARDAGPILVSTVDAWCAAREFVRFVDGARRRPADAVVLAVTPLVADEKPLWVDLDAGGRITALGGGSGSMVTAGMYLLPGRLRRSAAPSGLGRLREYLAWLYRAGEPLYGEVVPTVVDVDRAEDVALAASLAVTGREP